MKVITIRQPFATLIAEGLKEYEFRSWKTEYRGEILIHAGKTVDREAIQRFSGLGMKYPTGCILAKATLDDCIEVDDELREMLRQKNFPIYSGTTENLEWKGYGFHLKDVEHIEPIPAKGMLGLWEYTFEECTKP